MTLRESCRNRYYLVDLCSDIKRKITALLDQVFSEFETQFDSIFCKSAIAAEELYDTGETVQSADWETCRDSARRQQWPLWGMESTTAPGVRQRQF